MAQQIRTTATAAFHHMGHVDTRKNPSARRQARLSWEVREHQARVIEALVNGGIGFDPTACRTDYFSITPALGYKQ